MTSMFGLELNTNFTPLAEITRYLYESFTSLNSLRQLFLMPSTPTELELRAFIAITTVNLFSGRENLPVHQIWPFHNHFDLAARASDLLFHSLYLMEHSIHQTQQEFALA